MFPSTWNQRNDRAGNRGHIAWWRALRHLVLLDIGCSEWNDVESKLRESIPGAKLVKLMRYEDRLLWRDFFMIRESIKLRRGEANVNESHFWHGTGTTDPEVVLRHQAGLDPRFSTGGFYGRGVYLADSACYSNNDRYAFDNQNGQRTLLLVRAVEGVSHDYGTSIDRNLTKPPVQDATNGILYDSVRAGPHRPHSHGPGTDQSRMLVLYNLVQCYPDYVVTYTI